MANSLKHECTGFVCVFLVWNIESLYFILKQEKVINIDKSLLLQNLINSWDKKTHLVVNPTYPTGAEYIIVPMAKETAMVKDA